MADTTVTAKFRADISDMKSKMDEISRGLDGMNQKAEGAGKGFTVLRGSIANALGTAAIGAISSAGKAMQQFVGDAIDMARESELTVRRLDAVAQSMGVLDTVLGGSTQRLQDYAQELQNLTGVSDETVKAAQAIVLTFSEVASTAGETGGIFDRVTLAALDLAAVGFGSVEGNAKSLARALQDPSKGLTMLSRQGVSFTKQEQEKIKALQESNQLFEAQNLIMAAVEKQVGGTAEATATGAAKMSAAFADFQESIGLALLPVIDSVADRIRTDLLPAFQDMWDTHGPELIAAIEQIADIIVDVGIPSLQMLGQQLVTLAGDLADTLKGIADFTQGASDGLSALGVDGGEAGKMFQDITNLMNPAVMGLKLLGSVGRQTSAIFGEDLTIATAKATSAMQDGAAASRNAATSVAQAGAAADTATAATNALNAAQEKGVQAVMTMKAGYEELQGVLSTRRAKDTAIQASKDLEEALKKNGSEIKGTTDKAMDNRAKIDALAGSYMKWAQEAENPILAQKRLEKGAKELQDTLKAAGIDPESDPVYRSLKKQAEQGAETVGELKKAQRDAQIAGQAVGKDFVAGIVAEAKRREADARKAGQGVGRALQDGAEDALGIDSPSKVGRRIGQDFIAGVVQGLNADKAYQKASDLAKAVVSAFEQEMSRVEALVDRAYSAGLALADLVAKPFGTASQVMQNFGRTAGIPQIVSGIKQVSSLVREAYSPLLDSKIVGPAAARRNRQEMNAQLGTLQAYGQHAVNLRNQYQANLTEITRLEGAYQARVEGINAHYDAMEAAARANIQNIEAHWAGVIKGLQADLQAANAAYAKENAVLERLLSERNSFLARIASGFRSFVNSLRFEARKAVQAIKETTTSVKRVVKEYSDGMRTVIETQITPVVEQLEEATGADAFDAADIKSALEERLVAVQEFSRNIRDLIARGLDPEMVEEFVSAGVSSAGDVAAALVKASDSELRAINDIQSSLRKEVSSFQEYASKQWHEAGILQQEAVVAPLRAAAEAAQKALEMANAARDAELAAARAHLAQLAADRAAALAQAKAEHEKEIKAIQDENLRLEEEMDDLAQKIDDMLTELAMDLPPKGFEAGQDYIQKLADGFAARFPAVKKKLNGLMDQLVNSLKRPPIIIDVITRFSTIGAPPVVQGAPVTPRAMGGPVSARMPYLVGERGPELFMPGISGTIIPNSKVPTTATPLGGGGTIINVNVTTGMMTDPAEVGRVVVESISKYERLSGPVYARA